MDLKHVVEGSLSRGRMTSYDSRVSVDASGNILGIVSVGSCFELASKRNFMRTSHHRFDQ